MGLPLLANPSFSLFLWSFQYQWKGREYGLRPSVPFLTTIFPLLFVLPLSRTSFSGVLISPAAYCFISLASYLLSHLTPILQFHLNASSLRITYVGCFPALLLLLLSCCSVVFISLCNAVWKMSEGQASTSLLENSSYDQIFKRWYFVAVFDFSVMFTEVVFCSCTLKKSSVWQISSCKGAVKLYFLRKLGERTWFLSLMADW